MYSEIVKTSQPGQWASKFGTKCMRHCKKFCVSRKKAKYLKAGRDELNREQHNGRRAYQTLFVTFISTVNIAICAIWHLLSVRSLKVSKQHNKNLHTIFQK